MSIVRWPFDTLQVGEYISTVYTFKTWSDHSDANKMLFNLAKSCRLIGSSPE